MLSQGEQNLVVRASQKDIAEPTACPILNTEKQNLTKTILLNKWIDQFFFKKNNNNKS